MTKQKAHTENVSERFEPFPEAWLQNQLFEQTKDYLTRGRRFERLELDRLNEAWAKAFRQFVGRQVGPCGRDLDDAGAELRLRCTDFPTHLVALEVERLRAAVHRLGPIFPSVECHRTIDGFARDRDEPRH